MTAWLADECLPLPIVAMLRGRGEDVRYAAESDHRSDDEALLAIAQAEGRIIVTEDFDFGELLVRRRQPVPGCIVVFMPDASAGERAARVAEVIARDGFDPAGRLTILTRRRIRQRALGE
jgi:predicted nuclease of predicted toxin-antitoxin system